MVVGSSIFMSFGSCIAIVSVILLTVNEAVGVVGVGRVTLATVTERLEYAPIPRFAFLSTIFIYYHLPQTVL